MKCQSKKILFRKAIPEFVREVSHRFPDIAKHFDNIEIEELKHKNICDETYGSKSMIYITFESMEIRRAFEEFIKYSKEYKFRVCDKYSPNQSISEIQVSYFRGNNWNV